MSRRIDEYDDEIYANRQRSKEEEYSSSREFVPQLSLASDRMACATSSSTRYTLSP